MKKNDSLVVDIIDMTFDAMGIAKDEDGFVIFVKDALLGEKVKITILKVTKNIAYAKTQEILTPSLDRVTPICPIANKCGGCVYQHINYKGEKKIKKKNVINALKSVAKTSFDIDDTLSNDEKFFYRNKMLMPVGKDETGNINIGFYRARSHSIIPCTQCFISNKDFKIICDKILEILRNNKVEPYDEVTKKGLIRHIFIRQGYSTKETMVGIVATKTIGKLKDILITELLALNLNIVGIVENINNSNTNVILGEKTKVIYGHNYIEDIINNIKFRISCQSFYQINTPMAEILYNKVLSFLGDSSSDVVFDLYCGIGTISLCLSKKAKFVYAVESNESAVKNAMENKEINHIENVEFICDLAQSAVPKLMEINIIPDVIVLDPPRSGCEKTLVDTILSANPKKIIYISCNPATLSRDLTYFTNENYEIKSITPVDLFPKTRHVETVVLLERAL